MFSSKNLKALKNTKITKQDEESSWGKEAQQRGIADFYVDYYRNNK